MKVEAIAESINIMGTRSGNAMRTRDPEPILQMAREIVLVGEGLNVMNHKVYEAIVNRDEETLTAMAAQQVENGATALDLNLGQHRQLGRLTPWLVETIQGAVNVPLFLSSHVLRQQRGLEVHKGRPTINAVTANPTELPRAMETAKYFDADLVVLLAGPGLTPVDVEGRLRLTIQVLETADIAGFSHDRLYIDPLISWRHDPAARALSAGLPDIDTLVESIRVIREITAGRLRTILGISNSSLGLPPRQRSAFHCRLLPMLMDAGLDAVIMNCRDQRLVEVAGNGPAALKNAT